MVLDHLKLKLPVTASHLTDVLGTEVWFSRNVAKHCTAVPSLQLLIPVSNGHGGHLSSSFLVGTSGVLPNMSSLGPPISKLL